MDLSNDYGVAPARALEMLAQPSPALLGRAEEAIDLSALWTELVRGQCKIEETTFTEQSCAVQTGVLSPG